MTEKYTLDDETHLTLMEMLEDTLEFFCDEYMISGELAWLATECFAKSKLATLKGKL